MANLFHYTTFEGLEGILENRCLHAYDYKTMNDESELRHMLSFLIPIATEETKKILSSLKKGKEFETFINHHGGFDKLCEKDTKVMVKDAMYGNAIKVYRNFFITSFCAHEKPNNIKDGLLSQWRAYGKEQGYAIEFNKDQFSELIKNYCKYLSDKKIELVQILNDALDFPEKVSYPETQVEFKSIFSRKIEDIRKQQEILFDLVFSNNISGVENENSTKALNAIIELASGCKHHGFSEENEYRITTFFDQESDTSSNFLPIETKQRSDGTLRNYIELFKGDKNDDFVKNNLFIKSIKRILVGPSRHKENNAEKLRTMLNHLEETVGEGYKEIKVETSTIPYV